jgi:hypothetical protein
MDKNQIARLALEKLQFTDIEEVEKHLILIEGVGYSCYNPKLRGVGYFFGFDGGLLGFSNLSPEEAAEEYRKGKRTEDVPPPALLSEEDATKLAGTIFGINNNDDKSEMTVLLSKTYPDGWYFVSQSKNYIASNDIQDMMVGGAGLLIDSLGNTTKIPSASGWIPGKAESVVECVALYKQADDAASQPIATQEQAQEALAQKSWGDDINLRALHEIQLKKEFSDGWAFVVKPSNDDPTIPPSNFDLISKDGSFADIMPDGEACIDQAGSIKEALELWDKQLYNEAMKKHGGSTMEKAYVIIKEQLLFTWKSDPNEYKNPDKTGTCWVEGATDEELLEAATDRFSSLFQIKDVKFGASNIPEKLIMVDVEVPKTTPFIVELKTDTGVTFKRQKTRYADGFMPH